MLAISLLLFLILLIFFYFVTSGFIKLLWTFFLRLTQNEKISLDFLSFFLLVGTVIHELSHMILAEILFVRTGQFSFKPQLDEDNQVRIGSVKMVSADPIRRTLIGLAPLISGLTIIGFVSNLYLLPTILGPRPTPTQGWWASGPSLGLEQFLILLAVVYLLFTVSLTMFPSPKDLEPIIFPVILIIIIALVFQLAGIKLTFSQSFVAWLDGVLTGLNKGLGLVLGVNFVLLLFLSFLSNLRNLSHLQKR